MDGNNHFIRVDANNIVIHAFSDAFEQPLATDILIESNAGRHYNPILTDGQGNFIYKWDGTQMVDRTSDGKYQLSIAIKNKLTALDASCQSSLQTFTSNALGTKKTYLSRSDSVNNDWALFNGEFSFVSGSYYDNLPILWYTQETGNVNHTKDQFIQLFLNGRTAVASRKRQLAILEAQVNSFANSATPTTDINNVNAIVWVDPWAQTPSVPVGLAGTAGAAGSGQVTLNWTANTDVTIPNGGGYNIYVDSATTPKNTVLVTGTTFTVTGLTVGSHTLQISAVGANGIESAKCTAVTVTVS